LRLPWWARYTSTIGERISPIRSSLITPLPTPSDADIAEFKGVFLALGRGAHNHHTIDVVIRFFPFGTPPYSRLVGEFRRRIFEEVAASELPGLVFTYVWAFSDPADTAVVEGLAEIFRARGGQVLFVELQATQAERLRRNETPFRLAEKPFKRDLAQSRQQLLETDAKYELNSHGRFSGRSDYLVIENTALGPEQVADQVLQVFALPQLSRGASAP